MAINQFGANEALNIQLGQAGSVYESGTTAISAPTGKKIIAIMAVADSVFATLTPENANYFGRTSTASEYISASSVLNSNPSPIASSFK